MSEAQTHTQVKIGDLLVQEGFITTDALEMALVFQKQQPVYAPLGRICVELKLLSRQELQYVLSKYHKRMFLGELLVAMGLLQPDQVDEILATQKTTQKRFGKLLIERGMISEHHLIDALSLQLDIPKIIPSLDLIDRKLLTQLDAEFVIQNEFLPVYRDQNKITVVVADPLDNELLKSLETTFQCAISPAIAPASNIRDTLKAYYEVEQPLENHSAELSETPRDFLIEGRDMFGEGIEIDNTLTISYFILSSALLDGASSIHIEPQENYLRIRYRIDGVLRHKTDLPASTAPQLSRRLKSLCHVEYENEPAFQSSKVSARLAKKEVDIHLSTLRTIWGENLVLRIYEKLNQFLNIERLGFSPLMLKSFQHILNQPGGLILVSGPAGSGKSTTLYAAINHLNDLDKAIMTIEEPLEFIVPGAIQGAYRPNDQVSYREFVTAMLNQDPDVLMLGELNHAQIAKGAVLASLRGNKVLASLYSLDAVSSLLQLRELQLESSMISSTLLAIVCQRLVRRLCELCKVRVEPNENLLKKFGFKSIDLSFYEFYQPLGCKNCHFQGYKGQLALHETLMMNDAMREAIIHQASAVALRRMARENAQLISMVEDGFYKAMQGITSLEEVLRVAWAIESDRSTRSAEEIFAICNGNIPEYFPL